MVVGLVIISVADEAEMLPVSRNGAVKMFCSTEHSSVCKITVQQ